jgi:hypothetical protein
VSVTTPNGTSSSSLTCADSFTYGNTPPTPSPSSGTFRATPLR